MHKNDRGLVFREMKKGEIKAVIRIGRLIN